MQTAEQYRDAVLIYLRREARDAQDRADHFAENKAESAQQLAAAWGARAAAMSDAIRALPPVTP